MRPRSSQNANRPDLAHKEQAEADDDRALSAARLTDEQLDAIVADAIEQTGAGAARGTWVR